MLKTVYPPPFCRGGGGGGGGKMKSIKSLICHLDKTARAQQNKQNDQCAQRGSDQLGCDHSLPCPPEDLGLYELPIKCIA